MLCNLKYDIRAYADELEDWLIVHADTFPLLWHLVYIYSRAVIVFSKLVPCIK